MIEEWFDYIIVGAGSAGCVLANRLSAEASQRVLLLEAGGSDWDPWIHIPAGYFRNMMRPRLGWGYKTAPDPGLGGRRISWPRGKVLGGSSALNGLIYIRGQREDFDLWRQFGNTGWGYDDVLPYFRRAENQERGADASHGSGGPLGVSDARMRNELSDAYLAAIEQLGIPCNDDFNGPQQEGCGYYQFTTRNGLRSSTGAGYLRPVRNRRNLTVRCRALVGRIGLTGKRADRVEYTHHDITQTVRARREIILCGGTINSPQLLQLSGIGPGAVLQEAGIETKHELAGVGENLQDHIQIRLIYRCASPDTLNEKFHSPVEIAKIVWQYVTSRSGPATIGAGLVGFFTRTRDELASPDIQCHFMPVSVDLVRTRGKKSLRPHRFPAFTASICQLRPESRGTVRVVSARPADHPEIQANSLATQYDCDCLIAGGRLARRIAQAPAMVPYVISEELPGPDTRSDEDWLRFIRKTGTTIYHPAGTCKMGVDEKAVVDPQLRVIGIDGLRVADASIMPTVVSGNTNAATIMIAEKAADLIMGL